MIDITKERPISIKRAAAFMDVNQRTIERWFALGLDRVKFGGKVYTTRAALQRFAIQSNIVAKRFDIDALGELSTDERAEHEAAMKYLDEIGAT